MNNEFAKAIKMSFILTSCLFIFAGVIYLLDSITHDTTLSICLSIEFSILGLISYIVYQIRKTKQPLSSTDPEMMTKTPMFYISSFLFVPPIAMSLFYHASHKTMFYLSLKLWHIGLSILVAGILSYSLTYFVGKFEETTKP